jgi:hypothetical protein
MLLIVGYGLLSGLYLKFKFTKLFYIRMSILSYLFYVLSDNLLYTLVFTIFILISVNVYHKNSLVERFEENLKDKSKNKDKNESNDLEMDDPHIEMHNNKQNIEDFYEFSNKLLKNEDFISGYKDHKNKDNIKINKITKNIQKIKTLLKEND